MKRRGRNGIAVGADMVWTRAFCESRVLVEGAVGEGSTASASVTDLSVHPGSTGLPLIAVGHVNMAEAYGRRRGG